MYTIKQTKELTKIPEATLRYYDKEQIISPKRRENGYRLYDNNDILQLKYLSLLKYAKFPLSDIKVLIKAENSEFSKDCTERCTAIFSGGILRLQKAVDAYQKILSLLKTGLNIAENFCGESDKTEIINFIEKFYNDIIIKGE